MSKAKEVQLLRDPDVFPTDDVLAHALGESFGAYNSFVQKLPEFGIVPEWKYYNDGKSWLGKCVYKQKTVFWLSVWEGYFRLTFFFTEKTSVGIPELPLDNDIKMTFRKAKSIGKLFPLMVNVDSEAILDDCYALIEYKLQQK